MAKKKKWASINDPVKKKTKSDVYYDPHMKMYVPVHKAKAKNKKSNFKLKIKAA